MTLKAVIFDVDGTLADTEEAHRLAFNATFRDFCLPWEWDVLLYRDLLAVTGGKERIRHYCQRFFPRFLNEPAAEETIAFLHTQKTRRYTHRVAVGGVLPRPGVVRLIRDLRAAEIRLAIATTTSRVNLDALLATSFPDLPADSFEVIGTGEMVSAKKPAPDIYRWVLGKLDLPPDECLAIEDSRNGLAAARGAGLPVLITECSWTTGDDFSAAIAVLSDLGEPHHSYSIIRSMLRGIGYVDAVALCRWHIAWRVATQGLSP